MKTNNMDMDLQNKEFNSYKIKGIFTLESGAIASFTRMIVGNMKVDCVGATSRNNGNVGFVDSRYQNQTVKGNCIVFIRTGQGSVGDAIYKNNRFIPSKNVSVGRNKKLNKYIANFIVNVINQQAHKYNYGYVRSDERLENEILMLPTDTLGNPDYDFMEAYMRQKEKEKLDKYKQFAVKRVSELKNFKEVENLDEKEWGEFFIEDIANIESGKDIYEAERIEGNTPYVTSTANNNGIGYFVSNDNKTLESSCLSVNRNGSVGYSFYHSYKALFSNDCRKLRLNHANKHVGIFISQQITRQRGKYGYGYKMGTARLKRQKIMLPINQQQKPDYNYMENYMKRLEYQKLKKYLEYKKLES